MPNPDVFDPHSVDDMGRDPERWHETTWDALAYRLDHATREQLLQMAKETR